MNVFFLSGVLGFASGILCRSFVYLGTPVSAFLLFLGSVALVSYLRSRRRLYLLAAIVLIAFLLGMLRTGLAPMHAPEDLAERIGTEATVIGKVIADPDMREHNQRILIEEEDGTRMLVVANRFPEVQYGQTVEAQGALKEPEPFDADGGRVFRYDRFLAKDGVFAILHQASVSPVSDRETVTDRVRGALSDMKAVFMRALGTALPEPHASLAAGMLLGGKQGLGGELVDAFTITGLIHIVVLSGYNIMIIAEAVMRSLGMMPRRYAIAVASAAIAAFVLMAGAGAAAVRAGIMAELALLARATGRTYVVLHALALAMALMLLFNPLSLAFDPGFQLSVIATLGLILGAPLVESRLMFVRSTFLREILSATIAAQIAVLPLLLYQTGSLSLVSLIANVLVLPVVPLAMLLSFLASLAALLSGWLAPIAGLPAYAALGYVIGVTEFLANLPLAQVIVPAFPLALVIFMYAGLGAAVYRLRGS